MGALVYSAITSLDGYVADQEGDFGWAAPDEEVHAFVNDLERPNGTYLYGRRIYEVMKYWAWPDAAADTSPAMRDYRQIWQAADKVVHSKTLTEVTTPRTVLRRELEPEAVRRLKAQSAQDVSIGGPGLAAQALRAGLVDRVQLILTPVVVGGGTQALPDGLRETWQLTGQRRFDSGAVFLQYALRP